MLAASCLAPLLAAALGAPAASPETRPNIIFILTDDQRYGTLGQDHVQNHLRDYYASITALDREIGRVLDQIDNPNGDGDPRDSIADRTWVIFMSDNGWFTGHHRFTSKVLAYEEASRIPLIIRAPGIAPRVETQLVLNIDITGLLLSLAGVREDAARLDGLNLRALLENPATVWRKTAYLEAASAEPSLGARSFDAVVGARYKFIRTHADPEAGQAEWEELYDLEQDPHEMRNLASIPAHRPILQDMAAALESHLREIRGPGREPSGVEGGRR